jgi:hypothetical protein
MDETIRYAEVCMGFVNSIFGWGTVSFLVPLCIGFGWVAVSIPNPQFNAAQWAFTAATFILIIRVGIWISVENGLGSISRFPTILTSFVVFGLIGSVWISSLQWVNGLRPPSKAESGVSTVSTRSAFSATESLRVLPPGMVGKEKINLDNLAVLRLSMPSNGDVVTLIVAPVVTNIPANSGTLGGQVFTGYSQTLTFDRFKNKRHEVPIEGRTFIVTLLEINQISEPAYLAWSKEYVFGVSEK